MSYGAFVGYDFPIVDRRAPAPPRVPSAVLYGLVIALSAMVGHWMATVRAPAPRPAMIDAARPSIEPGTLAAPRVAPAVVVAASDPAQIGDVATRPWPLRSLALVQVGTATADRYAALIDPALSSGSAASHFASVDPVGGILTPFSPLAARAAATAVAHETEDAKADAPKILQPLPMVVQLVPKVPTRRMIAVAGPLESAPPTAEEKSQAADLNVVPLPGTIAEGVADVPLPPERPASLSPAWNRVAGLTPARVADARVGPVPSTPERVADVPIPPERPASLSSARTRVATLTPLDGGNTAGPALVPPTQVISEGIADVPLPPERPAFLAPPVREAQPRLNGRRRFEQRTVVARARPDEPDRRSFFERLFGMPQPPPPPGPALAYASPDNGGGLGLRNPRLASYGAQTAIYDIAAHTVYLPDGTRLEAHSGLGANLDDPSSLRQRMRGVTPPNLYDLGARAELFHGVRAIRLNPTDNRAMYGRDGMLAHTYMLGPRGDSNGCVVFRDYKAFLAAFDSGAIKRLAVVSSLN